MVVVQLMSDSWCERGLPRATQGTKFTEPILGVWTIEGAWVLWMGAWYFYESLRGSGWSIEEMKQLSLSFSGQTFHHVSGPGVRRCSRPRRTRACDAHYHAQTLLATTNRYSPVFRRTVECLSLEGNALVMNDFFRPRRHRHHSKLITYGTVCHRSIRYPVLFRRRARHTSLKYDLCPG